MGLSLEALARETPKQRWKRRLKKAALNMLFAALAYAQIVFGARLLHRRVLYQPPSDDEVQELPEGAAHGTFLKVPEGRHDNLYKTTSVVSALAAHAGS